MLRLRESEPECDGHMFVFPADQIGFSVRTLEFLRQKVVVEDGVMLVCRPSE